MIFTQLIPAAVLVVGGGHSELHPAGPNVYLELPDTQGVFAAYEHAPLNRLLHDDEVRVFAAKLAGEDPETFDIDALIQEGLDELYQEFPEALLIQALFGDVEALSISLSGVELRGMGSLLLASDFEYSPELAQHLEPAQVRVVVEFPGEDEEVLAKMFDSITALLPVEGAKRIVETAHVASLSRSLELTVWRNPDWMGLEAFATRDGSRVVFGMGVDSAAVFAASEASLAMDASYSTCGAPFDEVRGVPIYDFYWDLDGISEVSALVAGVEDVPMEVISATSLAMQMIAPGDRIEQRSRVCITDGRFISEDVSIDHDEEASFSDVMGQTPVTASAYDLVPQEAVAVWATTIDKRAMGDFLVRSIGDATGQDPEMLLNELEDQRGLRPRRDIIDSMGESFVFYTMPFSGIGAPKMFVALDLSDPEAFAGGVETLGETLAEMSGGALEFRSKPYRKSPFMSFAPGDIFELGEGGGMAQMAPAMFTPNIAIGVLDGRAIVSLSSIYTKREMKRMLKGDTAPHSLASSDSVLPEGVVAYGTTDWGEILGSLYRAVKGMLPLAQQAMGGELPFDLEDLPGDDLFARYIVPTTSWSRKFEAGTYSYNESSFGPEVLTVVMGATIGTLGTTEVSSPNSYRIEVSAGGGSTDGSTAEGATSPVQATRDVLSSVKVGIVVYQNDQGTYPGSLSDLVEASPNFPDGYLNGPEVPVDGWGRALLYELSEDGGSFRVWSAGPNGVDDRGVGDDVNLGKRR